MMINKWEQKAFSKHKGALHRQLGYSPNEKIPEGLLNEIYDSKIGNKVRGHTVTPLLKKRVIPVVNAKKRK